MSAIDLEEAGQSTDWPGKDLAARIAIATQKAATPGYSETLPRSADLDVEAWTHVGDPLAEAMVREMRERKLKGRDFYALARELQGMGSEAADLFFADVETVPAWMDFEATRAGAEMTRRNPLGLLMGMHGALTYTYIDPATARVMGSTGRLTQSDADFARRFWETATGFIGALDVQEMRPGGRQWQNWVRIRLLHTMIRLGILGSGRWDVSSGMPISQSATASGAHIFGRYRVSIIRSCGGWVSGEEQASFELMWRWIARIEGANSELLGATQEEQLALAERISLALYQPNQESVEVTASMLDGLNGMKVFPMPRRLHAAALRRFMSELNLEAIPGHDVPGDLGVPRDRLAAAVLSTVFGGARIVNQTQRIPSVARRSSRWGDRLITALVERGLAGRSADYNPTPVRDGRPTR